MNLKALAAAVAIAAMPLTASAVTSSTNGSLEYTPGSFNPLLLDSLTDGSGTPVTMGADFGVNSISVNDEFAGNLAFDPAAASQSGSIWFEFQSTSAGVVATNFSTDSIGDPFTDLTISWLAADMATVLNSISGPGIDNASLTTTFTTDLEIQFLRATWTGFSDARNLDFTVSAVPLPAGVLLLGSAFAVLGFSVRRRSGV